MMTDKDEMKHFIQQITLDDMHAEICRELAVRSRVYPNWIEQGKLSRETANYRILVLEAAALELSVLRSKRKPQQSFFDSDDIF